MSSFNGFKEVAADKLDTLDFNPYKKIGKEWFLVTAGDESGWNTMTASWGFAGVMWGKNTFTTVIRPQRYTKEFIDKAEYFTISFFKEEYKKALSFCGSHSGRDCDKAKETGLTPVFVSENGVEVTAFAEADILKSRLCLRNIRHFLCFQIHPSSLPRNNLNISAKDR